MTSLVGNEEVPLTKDDCIDWLGGYKSDAYVKFCQLRVYEKQPIGEAWFNSLDKESQAKLRGSFFDPFYKDTWDGVIRALRFLLAN